VTHFFEYSRKPEFPCFDVNFSLLNERVGLCCLALFISFLFGLQTRSGLICLIPSIHAERQCCDTCQSSKGCPPAGILGISLCFGSIVRGNFLLIFCFCFGRLCLCLVLQGNGALFFCFFLRPLRLLPQAPLLLGLFFHAFQLLPFALRFGLFLPRNTLGLGGQLPFGLLRFPLLLHHQNPLYQPVMTHFVTEPARRIRLGAQQEKIGELFEQSFVHAWQGTKGAAVGVDAVGDAAGGVGFYELVFDHAAGGVAPGFVG